MLGGAIFIPYAIEVDGQIMVLYDPVYHHRPDDGASRSATPRLDALWVGAEARATTGATSGCSGRWCSPAAS